MIIDGMRLARSRRRTFVDRLVMESSMSTLARITGADFDAMVARGAFDMIGPRKVELIHGELRFRNPAGPAHDDHIEFLNDWSVRNTTRKDCNVRVQAGFVCQDNRPEPDVLWLRPKRYGRQRPTVADVLLLIEVSDSSLSDDLREKADLYSEGGVAEYWVVDIPNQRIHIMSDIHDGRYRRIEMHVAPDVIAPQCKPDARLKLAELFDI
jgi:Uma2 family endonuclease